MSPQLLSQLVTIHSAELRRRRLPDECRDPRRLAPPISHFDLWLRPWF